MFLRCSTRRKDGKEHLCWSVVENRRVSGDHIVQRHVLYLGELNGRQEASVRKSVEIFGQDDAAPQQVALYPEEYAPDTLGTDELPIVRIRLSQMSLRRPRQWGACWLGCELWRQLGGDAFWDEHLPAGREGTRWDQVLQTLVLYRLISPGAEPRDEVASRRLPRRGERREAARRALPVAHQPQGKRSGEVVGVLSPRHRVHESDRRVVQTF